MNREEAIRKVENCLASYFPMEDYGEVEEIIKALEQEPCEDAISRKAMLNYQQYLHGRMSNEENHKLWEFIKNLPSVTLTQKTGQWIFVDKSHEHARCSECGYGNVDLLDGKPHNFCPNCGSFMMEDEQTLEYADQNAMMSAT